MQKILCISDLHVPYTDLDAFQRIMEEHADENTICVFNGDIFDNHAKSSFVKRERIPLFDEYTMAQGLIYAAASIFKEVHLTKGNHEERSDRRIRESIPVEARFLYERDLIIRIANGEEYTAEGELVALNPRPKIIVNKASPSQAKWFTRIGNTLFGHPSSYSKYPCQVPLLMYEYLQKHGQRNVDCAVVGHTHRLCVTYYPHLVLMETGNLAKKMPYAEANPHLKYGTAQKGYAIIMQDDEGNVIPQETKVIPI